MKHFLIYTVLRFALFFACWAVVAGIAAIFFDASPQVGICTFMIAALISTVLSLKVLEGPRLRFAASVDARAHRAAARFDELKQSEDVD